MIEYLEDSWKNHLNDELEKDYFKTLSSFIKEEHQTQTIFPPKHLTFSALNHTKIDEIKVVLLGQDPYHNHSNDCFLGCKLLIRKFLFLLI